MTRQRLAEEVLAALPYPRQLFSTGGAMFLSGQLVIP